MKQLAAAFAFVCLTCHAEPGDIHLIIHGLSYHTIPNGYNQTNIGAGVRYELGDTTSLQVGAYKNSFYRKSVYGVIDWMPLSFKQLHFGGFFGAASGYAEKAGVAGGGLIRWQGQTNSVTLRIVPAKCSIFALEYGLKF